MSRILRRNKRTMLNKANKGSKAIRSVGWART